MSKRIKNRITVIELKREFGIGMFNFFTYDGKFSHSCYLSKENYFDKYSSRVDDPDIILDLLTKEGVRFNFEGKWYKDLQELYEEVLILRLSDIL